MDGARTEKPLTFPVIDLDDHAKKGKQKRGKAPALRVSRPGGHGLDTALCVRRLVLGISPGSRSLASALSLLYDIVIVSVISGCAFTRKHSLSRQDFAPGGE